MRYRYPNPRRRPAGSAIQEHQGTIGELSEELTAERRGRPPILTPRGLPTDNPFGQMPVSPAPPAVRPFNPNSHSTYRVDLAAGVAVQFLAQSRERSYLLIVNAGATDAVLTYGRIPGDVTDGIPLANGGVGFHELISGTIGTAGAMASAATFLIVTEGRFDPPMES